MAARLACEIQEPFLRPAGPAAARPFQCRLPAHPLAAHLLLSMHVNRHLGARQHNRTHVCGRYYCVGCWHKYAQIHHLNRHDGHRDTDIHCAQVDIYHVIPVAHRSIDLHAPAYLHLHLHLQAPSEMERCHRYWYEQTLQACCRAISFCPSTVSV